MDSEIELTSNSWDTETHLATQIPISDETRGASAAEFSLLPADQGKDAWLMLASSFLVEALIWGFPFTWGIWQEWYSQHEPFSSDASNLAVVGTSATGLMYMSSIVLMPCYGYWPWIRRISAIVGLPILVLGLVAASFAQTVTQLVLTQGACYGIGGAMLYCPTILFIDEWFIRRKGLAFGIMWAGTGVSGMVLPFVINWALGAFGFRDVLRVWAGFTALLLAPSLFYLKPRLPTSGTRQSRPLNFTFLLSPAFWTLETSSILQSLGYFLPSIYLPTIAQRYGSSSLGAALTLVAQNLAAVVGGLAIGALVDRFHVTSVMMMIAIVSTSAVFLVWGFSESLPLLIIFSALYGASAGGFSTCWSGVVKDVQRRNAGADSGLIFGMLSTGRGIGAIVSGPLSAALVQGPSFRGAAYGYGSDFGGLIVFTGVTATAGSLGFLARRLGWI